MANVNKVILVGRLGKDWEQKFTPTGKLTAKTSIAVNETWKGTDGEKKERTEWINLEAWEKRAETLVEYTGKGSQIYIEGKLKTDKYEAEGQTRYFTKVVVEFFQFLGSKNGNGAGEQMGETQQPEGAEIPVEDDIPF